MGANESKDEVSENPKSKTIQKLIKEKGIAAVQEQMSKELQKWREEEIKLCVTGMGGVGKSHFINAIRGYETFYLLLIFSNLFYHLYYFNVLITRQTNCLACPDPELPLSKLLTQARWKYPCIITFFL